MATLAGRVGVAPAFGLLVGVTVVATFPTRSAPLWTVWAPIALALSTASGLAVNYGVNRWNDLVGIQPLRARTAAQPVVVCAGLILVATNVTWLLKGDAHADWRNTVLTGSALVASIPLASVINGIRLTAAPAEPASAGHQLLRIIRLRELLDRSLAVGGAILALITLQTGSLLSLQRSMHAPFGNRPPAYVLVFGGVATVILVLAYVPSWRAVQEYAGSTIDALFPIDDLTDASAVLLAAANRKQLREILSVQNDVFADLQSGIAALTPLLAGVASAFLPH